MEKYEKDSLYADFYANARDNTLNKFYNKYSGRDHTLLPETYEKIVEISYDYFCMDPVIDRETGAQQSIAAKHLDDLNKKAAKAGGNSAEILEHGKRTAAIMSPNELQLAKDWESWIGRVHTEKRNKLIEDIQEHNLLLGIQRTVFGAKAKKKYELYLNL